MSKLLFLKQYILNARNIGAVAPSTKYLADKMIESIDFNKTKFVIEYGPGSGVFTDKLIQNKKRDTILILIENNYKFYTMLKNKYTSINNLYIFYDSAENIDIYMKLVGMPYADFIISGLPFASLPKSVSTKILNKSSRILNEEGKFIAFQYTWFKKRFFKHYFETIDTKREFRNIPPAFVFECMNGKCKMVNDLKGD